MTDKQLVLQAKYGGTRVGATAGAVATAQETNEILPHMALLMAWAHSLSLSTTRFKF